MVSHSILGWDILKLFNAAVNHSFLLLHTFQCVNISLFTDPFYLAFKMFRTLLLKIVSLWKFSFMSFGKCMFLVFLLSVYVELLGLRVWVCWVVIDAHFPKQLYQFLLILVLGKWPSLSTSLPTPNIFRLFHFLSLAGVLWYHVV